MPQGTIPRGKAFFDPKLKGRWGAARLAAMTHAPVIPVGSLGDGEGLAAIGSPSQRAQHRRPADRHAFVSVQPVPLKYQSADADTKRIMKALMDLLPPESRVKREPSPEELAAALPPGYKGDVDAEPRRRPGTD